MTQLEFAAWCQQFPLRGNEPLSRDEQELLLQHGLRHGGAEEQAVPWHAAAWAGACDSQRALNRAADLFSATVELLADELGEAQPNAGTRLVARGRRPSAPLQPDRPVCGVTGVGYGDRGYGFYRTKRVFADNTIEQIRRLGDTLTDIGAGDPGRSWVACERAHRLRFLGPAFSTKVAHFAGYDMATRQGPLIADENTAWGVWALSARAISNVRTNANMYASYVHLAEHLATADRTPADIEYALFKIGPEIKNACRR